jgi:hypothetical protein
VTHERVGAAHVRGEPEISFPQPIESFARRNQRPTRSI